MNGFAAAFGKFFLGAVNASIAASWLILAVLAVRLCMKLWGKHVPKWTRILLWAIVGIRLILPVSVKTDISLLPSAETFPVGAIYNENPEISNNPMYLRLDSGVTAVDRAVPTQKVASGYIFRDRVVVAGCVWLAGILAILLYMGLAGLRLKRDLRESIPAGEGILESDGVHSPFIWGIFRPNVYLPSDLAEPDRTYVLAHEATHLRRKDHIWKLAGYLIRTVHWFNPLVWLSYMLFQRDLELACDEAVIGDMDFTDKKAYSKALLDCGMHRRRRLAHPLAFGEIGVKERIGNVLRYRKPAVWAIPAVFMACLLLAACFLTNPARRNIGKTSGQYTALLYERKEDVLAELGLTEDEIIESPLRTFRLPYQEYAAGQPYVVNLRFDGDNTLGGFSYSMAVTDAGKAFAEYDLLIGQLAERLGDPVTAPGLGSSYLADPNPQNSVRSAASRWLSEEWYLEGQNLRNRDRLVLRASIRYSEQYDQYTIQLDYLIKTV